MPNDDSTYFDGRNTVGPDEQLSKIWSPQETITKVPLGIATRWDDNTIRSTGVSVTATPTGGMLSARTESGMRITDPADLTPDCIVDIEGLGGETTVAVALSMGALARDPTTGLIKVAGSAAAAQSEDAEVPKEQRDQEAPVTRLDDHSETVLADAFERAHGPTLAAAVDAIGNDGVLSSESTAQLATALGIDPAAVQERFAHVSRAYEAEAVNVAAQQTGASREVAAEALAAARAGKSNDLREAAERHFHEGKAEYAHIVRAYVSGLDETDPRRILEANPVAGRSVRWDPNSRCVVVSLDDDGGYEMTWADAVNAGLVSLK